MFVAPHRDELFIGGIGDRPDGVVVPYRGNMEPLLVPASWFEPSGNGVRPDFADFEVTDFGQAIRPGPHEAAGDAIPYAPCRYPAGGSAFRAGATPRGARYGCWILWSTVRAWLTS